MKLKRLRPLYAPKNRQSTPARMIAKTKPAKNIWINPNYREYIKPILRKQAFISELEYISVHQWIKALRDKALYCAVNREHISKRYEWANISREYRYDIHDWIPLCSVCHHTFDYWKLSVRELKRMYGKRKKVNYYLEEQTKDARTL